MKLFCLSPKQPLLKSERGARYTLDGYTYIYQADEKGNHYNWISQCKHVLSSLVFERFIGPTNGLWDALLIKTPCLSCILCKIFRPLKVLERIKKENKEKEINSFSSARARAITSYKDWVKSDLEEARKFFNGGNDVVSKAP